MNAPAAQETVVRMPLARLRPSPLNPRKHLGPLDELAASIKAVDVLEPLVVRDVGDVDAFEIVFGHRRHAGAELAGKPDVPVIVREYTDDQVLEAQVIENGRRSNVHPLDEADGYQMMLEKGWTPQRIADRTGLPLAHVVQRLKLCGLSKACRQALDEENITIGVALLLAKLPTQKLQDEGLSWVGKESRFGDGGLMSVKEARESLEANVMLALKAAPFKLDDAALVPAAGACTTCPKRTGNQVELFADASSPDLCTDPVCHRSKVDALWQIRSKKHKDNGGEVLSAKDAKHYFGHNHFGPALDVKGRYKALGDRVYVSGKSQTVRQLFKGELPPITLAKDPESGMAVELVDRKLADKAAGTAKTEGREKPSSSEQAANRRERLKDQARTEATRRALTAAADKAASFVVWETFEPKVLNALALAVVGSTWFEGRKAVVKRRVPEPAVEKPKKGKRAPSPTRDVTEELQALVASSGSRELGSIIVELLLSRGAPAKHSDEPSDDWAALTAALGVRYDAILANVVEEQRKAEAEKGKAKPKAPAKPKRKKAAKKKAKS